MSNTETVRALVSAFNVNNHFSNTVETNFMLQSRYGKDYIVVSFDKSMDTYQCKRYLDSIKRKIVGEFYGIEEGDTDEVVLNTANLIFNIESFPFDTSRGKWSQDEQGRIEFLAPIDKGVIFNLKSHLASSLVKDVLEGMPTCSIVTNSFNKGKYLCHSKFPNKELCKQFEREFLSRMRERYENVFKNPLKIEGNSVYIRDVFDDARFIDSVIRYKTWLEGMYLGVDSSANHKVKLFKDMIVESIGQLTGVTIYGFVCASPLDRKEASILLPLVLDGGRKRTLTNEEALELNCAFNYAVFNDLYGRTQGELSVDGRNGVYGIDFSNPYISHCVITKIMESSVINKDHELAIDPERVLSPAQSPFNSPTHAEPSGLRTPPNQEKDEGYHSNSPQKPEDSVAHSSSSDPRSSFEEIQEPQSCFPRQGALLYHNVGAAEVVAAENVQAGTSAWSQLMNPYLSQGTSGNKWQPLLQFPGPGFSDSSGKGAVQNVQAGSSASSRWSSQSTSSGFSDSLWTQSGSSSNKRPDSTHSADSGYSGSLERPQPNSSITTSAVPGISESGKGSNVAAVPVDNKRPQSLPLTENTPKPSSESPKKIIQQFLRNFSIRRSKTNGKATKDILQFDKEKFSSFSSGMQKVLSLPLSLDMIRNLFPHFPIEKWEKLILLARSEKVKKSHSSPKKIEQLLSSLLPEEQEICSLLFFPDRKNETYVDLSPGAREQMVLFWELLRGQEFTEESGIFSGSSSQGSVSSELKHPQQVKHMSEALGK